MNTSQEWQEKVCVEAVRRLWDAIIFFLLNKYLHAISGSNSWLKHMKNELIQ